MASQSTKEKLEQFMVVEFSEISKRYEKYDPKTRSLMFLDKLHLISNFIAAAIAIDEIDTMDRQERETSNSVNPSNISRFESTSNISRFAALKVASDAFKTEINAL